MKCFWAAGVCPTCPMNRGGAGARISDQVEIRRRLPDEISVRIPMDLTADSYFTCPRFLAI